MLAIRTIKNPKLIGYKYSEMPFSVSAQDDADSSIEADIRPASGVIGDAYWIVNFCEIRISDFEHFEASHVSHR